MALPFFKDFDKSAKDLLSKNFNPNEHKLEIVTKAKDASFTTEWTSRGTAKLESEYSLPSNASLNVECRQDSNITATLKVKDAMPGATLKSKASTNNKFFLGAEYVRAFGTFTAEIDHDLVKGSVVNASALLVKDRFTVGASACLLPSTGLSQYVIGGSYAESGKYQASAKLTENLEKASGLHLLVQYIHFAKPNLTVGANLGRTLDQKPTTTAEIGGVYTANDSTKVGFKINHSAQIGLYALHQLNSNFTLTHSLQVDTADSSAHRFGLGVKFSA